MYSNRDLSLTLSKKNVDRSEDVNRGGGAGFCIAVESEGRLEDSTER